MARRWQIINDNWAIRLKGHYLNRLIYSSAFVFPLPQLGLINYSSLVRQQLPSQIRRRKWLAGCCARGYLSVEQQETTTTTWWQKLPGVFPVGCLISSPEAVGACWLGCKKSRPAISINYLIKPSESIHPVWAKRGGTARARRRSWIIHGRCFACDTNSIDVFRTNQYGKKLE